MADENIRSLEVGDPEEVEDIQLGAGEPEETEEIVLDVDVSDDVSAKQAEAWAVGERGGVPVSSTDPAYENNAKYYAGRAENAQLDVAGMMDTVESARLEVAEMMDAVESIRLDVAGMIDGAESARDAAAGSAEDAEAWAVGQRNGTDVVSTDPAYANNARYYAGRAASSAGDASGSATAASESAQTASGSAGNAEAWAVGKRNGVDVGSGDSTYHNNAKYYAGQAATSASQAENSVQLAAGYATNASGSADTASQYAQAATQKASAANTSAGNAAASEQAASQSKTLAGQSASAAAQSEQNAAGSAQAAGQYAGQASGYASNASDSATAAAGSANAAGGAASSAAIAAANAEAWAVGQRNGTDVVDTDPAYENNALYYAGRAAESATAASGSAGNAAQSAMSAGTSADNAEAWAVGQREGTDVESTDPAFENNAKYYAGRAAETLQAVAILESGSTATHAIAKGRYVVWQGIGCVALSDIAIGDTLATSGAGSNLTICAAGVANHLSEQKADNILKTISTPAAIQSFDDGADNLPVKQMQIAIEPVQDLNGYDYPWPGGGSKNLIPDGTDTNNGYVATHYLKADGSSGTSVNCYISEYFPVTAETNYTLSQNSTLTAQAICFYDENYDFVSGTALNGNESVAITTPVGAVWARCSQIIATDSRIIQFELGSTATTPLPYSNICPITGWTGCNITNESINIDGTDSTKGYRYNRYLNDNGDEVQGQTLWVILENTPVKGNTQYTLTGPSLSSNVYLWEYDTAGNPIKGTAYTDINPTIVTQANTAYVRISSNKVSDTHFYGNKNTYSITFPSAAGTVYGGTLTVNEDGTGTLMVNCKKIILGQVAGHIYSGVYLIDPTSDCADFTYDEVDPLLKSDRFKTFENKGITDFSRNAPDFSICGRNTSNNNMKLMLKDTRYTTAEAFVAAHGDAEIIYPLASPVSSTLTAPQIRTILGFNSIWADTGKVNYLAYYKDTPAAYEMFSIAKEQVKALQKSMIAPVLDSMVADTALAVNDFRIVDGTLYRVTAPIASEAALTVGTNVVKTSIGEQLTALLNA